MALVELSISNVAVIQQVDLDFESGLTVVSGETGAGKSIVLDALDMVLGARADQSLIRHGESQCEVQATFELSNHASIGDWLTEHDLHNSDQPQYCMLRRVIKLDKPAKCY